MQVSLLVQQWVALKQLFAIKEWTMNINEIGGRKIFRGNALYYLSLCPLFDAVIFVVDAQAQHLFNTAIKYFNKLKKSCKIDKAPVLLLFNNCDSYKEGKIKKFIKSF